MFPGGGAPDMQQLMQQAMQMQEQVQKAQEALEAAEVQGSAGGGLVTVTMSGTGELRTVTIDPSAIDSDDVETLQDLVVAAVRDGARAATDLAQENMAPITGGLGLPGLT